MSGTVYSDGFMRGATDYLRRTPGAFKDYLKTDFVPLPLRISVTPGEPGVCEKLAAGNPLGTGLIDAGDACVKGYASESCWMDCCDGNSVKTNIVDANKKGCSLYFEDNGGGEQACKALPGKR